MSTSSSAVSGLLPSSDTHPRTRFRDCLADVQHILRAEKVLETVRFRKSPPPKIDVVSSNELLITTVEPLEPDTVLRFREMGWVDTKFDSLVGPVYEFRRPRASTKYGMWLLYHVAWYVMAGGIILSLFFLAYVKLRSRG